MDFFIENINHLFKTNLNLLHITLPIGISFFTFQAISYLVDVYLSKVEASSNFIDFGAYLSFFPQLIAGPIVRYETISKELKQRNENIDDFYKGICRFVIGLFKKVVIANMLGEVILNLSLDTGLASIMLILSNTLQIYFDFSAYSDMAIGMGLMFGFHFNENFDHPLSATSVTSFWRKWHISLSSFFKDYVYIPLGGSLKGNLMVNILLVWLLTGLWHGADYNFIIWGLYFGLILIIEKYCLLKYLKNHNWIGFVYTFIIVNISFVIFSYSDFNDIFNILNIFNKPFIDEISLYYFDSYLIFFILAIIGMTDTLTNLYKKISDSTMKLNVEVILIIIIFIISVSYLLDAGFNPFLYFRF